MAPELERSGHAVVAPDLPCEDPNAGLDAYAQTVLDALQDAEDVVLVGHSMAGLFLPLVARARPIKQIVLLAALLPEPGRSLADQLRAEKDILLAAPRTKPDPDRRSRWSDPEAAARAMYTEADPDTARQAFARLRWQAAKPQIEPSPPADWPPGTEYVICTRDRMVSPDYGARASARHGLPVHHIASDHSPMLSRPAELSELLAAHAEAA